MSIKDLQAGEIFQYPYLWAWQQQRGETAGRKNRQTVLAFCYEKAELHFLFLLAITSKPPLAGQTAIKIPEAERKLARLDAMDLWIIVSEYNYDCLEHSFYFMPQMRVGKFSNKFTLEISRKLAATVKQKKAEAIRRAE